jgi:hypothetical protein
VAIQGQRTNRSRVNYSEKEGSDEYTDTFCLTTVKMEEFSGTVGPFMHRKTNRSHVLSEKQFLQIALHWLGRGGQYHSVGDMQGVSMVNIPGLFKKYPYLPQYMK